MLCVLTRGSGHEGAKHNIHCILSHALRPVHKRVRKAYEALSLRGGKVACQSSQRVDNSGGRGAIQGEGTADERLEKPKHETSGGGRRPTQARRLCKA
jgi:hypothetical protein